MTDKESNNNSNTQGYAGSVPQPRSSRFKYANTRKKVADSSYQQDAAPVKQVNPMKDVFKFPTSTRYGDPSAPVPEVHQINAKGQSSAVLPKSTISSKAVNVMSPPGATNLQRAAKARRMRRK